MLQTGFPPETLSVSAVRSGERGHEAVVDPGARVTYRVTLHTDDRPQSIYNMNMYVCVSKSGCSRDGGTSGLISCSPRSSCSSLITGRITDLSQSWTRTELQLQETQEVQTTVYCHKETETENLTV